MFMGRKKIILDKDELNRLYWGENLSPYKIAKIYNCSFTTITNRMKEHEINFKDHSEARIKYPGSDFGGNPQEKSYMIGFRLGDLNVYKKTPHSKVIIARCHTTDTNQVNLLKRIFKKYGRITISENNFHYQVNIHLNKSFDFLLTKKFISRGLDFYPFTAGYTEAEGCFQLDQGKARFKIDSYDVDVLKYISRGLNKRNINAKIRKISTIGTLRTDGTRFTHDLWRVNINKAEDLERFILAIRPFMIHGKYMKRSEICLKNIRGRALRRSSNER
jgi:intein-encoded DNA endonuclease-like protein